VLPPELKKFYRKAVGLFFIVTDMGIEARQALTRCQKSGHGCPRKLAEGSLRRNGQEGRDEVGDSHVLPPDIVRPSPMQYINPLEIAGLLLSIIQFFRRDED